MNSTTQSFLGKADAMSNDHSSKSFRENLTSGQPSEQELRSSLEQIGGALRGLKFGSVNVIVQDGVVVQIDRTEKVRLSRSGRPS
jgi:hypothetical protein